MVSAKGAPGTTASTKPSDNRGKPATSGSGFLVDGSGYVMTAAHVALGKGNEVSARAANGRVYGGQVIAILPDNDMALIRLKGYSGRAATPAKNQCISPGSMVYSLGKPHAQGDTARIGKLEAMSYGRAVQYGKFGYPDAMVLKMGTQKGESGGPVFNEQGQLVGMVVSTLDGRQRQPHQSRARDPRIRPGPLPVQQHELRRGMADTCKEGLKQLQQHLRSNALMSTR